MAATFSINLFECIKHLKSYQFLCSKKNISWFSCTTADKIFDSFFTIKEVGEGTGLGLAVSYGIIKDHDGVLEAKSKAGTGALFRLKLPVSISI